MQVKENLSFALRTFKIECFNGKYSSNHSVLNDLKPYIIMQIYGGLLAYAHRKHFRNK